MIMVKNVANIFFHNVKLLNENHVTYDVAMKAERLNKFSVAVSN